MEVGSWLVWGAVEELMVVYVFRKEGGKRTLGAHGGVLWFFCSGYSSSRARGVHLHPVIQYYTCRLIYIPQFYVPEIYR